MADEKTYTTVVTNVTVFPFTDKVNLGELKAMASITLNDCFVVRGLKLFYHNENGYWVNYPVDTFYKSDDYRSICHPITKELRELIEHAIVEKYKSIMG